MRPLLLLASLALIASTGPAAFAEGRITIPERLNTPAPGTDRPNGRFFDDDAFAPREQAPDCVNRPACESWFFNWREQARRRAVMRRAAMINLPDGANCIRDEDAFDLETTGPDAFKVRCFAERNGRLVSVAELDLQVQTASCLSDAEIRGFVNSQAAPARGAATHFLETRLKPCGFVVTPRRAARTYPMDVDWFRQLLNDRPSLRGIVDNDRRVKGAVPTRNRPTAAPARPSNNPLPTPPPLSDDSDPDSDSAE